jgi:beta-lactamase family protein
MRIRFWGTRGSLAKPGPTTLRYGGNTSCVEVRTRDGTLIVLDCGTGAHGLGLALAASDERPLRGHLMLSHMHWDHIQGFPFFAPLFAAGNEWDVYAPGGLGQHLETTLAIARLRGARGFERVGQCCGRSGPCRRHRGPVCRGSNGARGRSRLTAEARVRLAAVGVLAVPVVVVAAAPSVAELSPRHVDPHGAVAPLEVVGKFPVRVQGEAAELHSALGRPVQLFGAAKFFSLRRSAAADDAANSTKALVCGFGASFVTKLTS